MYGAKLDTPKKITKKYPRSCGSEGPVKPWLTFLP